MAKQAAKMDANTWHFQGIAVAYSALKIPLASPAPYPVKVFIGAKTTMKR